MKRIICWIMAILLFVSLLPGAAADEAAPMTMSEEGIAFLKTLEGFTAYRIWDHTQYTIGYGSAVSTGEYPNGITRDQADALLRQMLDKLGAKLNNFISTNHIALTQPQFDALLSFTYNIGAGWLSGCRLSRLLISGKFTEAEFASALGIWCHTGSQIHYGLLTRRIREAKIFLYGDYAGKTSRQYRYLVFRGNGGSVEMDVALYPQGSPYGKLPSATKSDRIFAGWQLGNGKMITAETIVSENGTATAQWTTQAPAAGVFKDVTKAMWFYTCVDELYNDHLISGYGDGTFRPNAKVTAGEALKLILLACGEKEQPAGAHWAQGYLELAEQKLLVTAEQLPDLNAEITRGLIAQIAAKRLGITAKGSGAFSDTQDEFAQALFEANILQGTADSSGVRRFNPEQTITRAELSAIAYRLKNI